MHLYVKIEIEIRHFFIRVRFVPQWQVYDDKRKEIVMKRSLYYVWQIALASIELSIKKTKMTLRQSLPPAAAAAAAARARPARRRLPSKALMVVDRPGRDIIIIFSAASGRWALHAT